MPAVFGAFKATLHVPRRPYVHALPGIPTIRPFEALACGIPLVCSPWEDAEGLFRPGHDYLVARNGAEMKRHLRALRDDPDLRRELFRRFELPEKYSVAQHPAKPLLLLVLQDRPDGRPQDVSCSGRQAGPGTGHCRSGCPE